MLTIRELSSDQDIDLAFPIIVQLRPHLRAEEFVATVRLQQGDGYRFFGGFEDGRLVVVAGARDARSLSRSLHLFVDDLVTLDTQRGKGYATTMLRWLTEDAKARGVARLYLDSRDSAIGYYKQLGFEFLNSVPCWIKTDHFSSE